MIHPAPVLEDLVRDEHVPPVGSNDREAHQDDGSYHIPHGSEQTESRSSSFLSYRLAGRAEHNQYALPYACGRG
jgi:hypothetical protein